MLRVIEIRNQIKKYMRRWKIPIVSNRDHEVIRKCIVSGYFANAARLAPDGSYRTVRDNIVRRVEQLFLILKGTSPSSNFCIDESKY